MHHLFLPKKDPNMLQHQNLKEVNQWACKMTIRKHGDDSLIRNLILDSQIFKYKNAIMYQTIIELTT